MIDNAFRQRLNEVCTAISGRAKFVDHPRYGKIPAAIGPDQVSIDDIQWGSLAEAYKKTPDDLFRMMFSKQLSGSAYNVEKAAETLEGIIGNHARYDGFAYLASSGTGTVAVLARNKGRYVSVLRIGHHEGSHLAKTGDKLTDISRSEFPGLIQPADFRIDGSLPDKKSYRVEELPLAQIVKLADDEKKVLKEYFKKITEGTIYDGVYGFDEVAVLQLPDGSNRIYGFDPGELPYAPIFFQMSVEAQYKAESDSRALVDQRQADWMAPIELQWVTGENQLAQDYVLPPTPILRDPPVDDGGYHGGPGGMH